MADAVLVCEPVIPDACVTCKKFEVDYEGEIIINCNLDANTNLYSWITDKFGNQYQWAFTTENNGAFILDTTDFPEGMFNPDAGNFDVFFSTDSDGIDVVTFTIDTIDYICLKFKTLCTDDVVYLGQDDGNYLLQDNGFKIRV